MGTVVHMDAGRPRRLSRDQFKDEVVQMVKDGRFSVASHLKRDHPERKISHAAIAKCLELGTVQCDPYLNIRGNWQADMYRHGAGEALTVAAAIEWKKRVIVITAY
jgi:hypothetical protein